MTEVLYKPHIVELAVITVNFRNFHFQGFKESLGQASHYIKFPVQALLFAPGKKQYHVYAFLLRVGNKSTRVDDYYFRSGVFGLESNIVTYGRQLAHNAFAVNKVFRATERYKVNCS